MPRIVCILLLAAIPLRAAPVRIACIGDSITEGTGLSNPATESYPVRLQALLGKTDYTVRNFGVSGRTLLKQGDYPYWNETAFTASRTFNPDIVIIQLGTNDAKPYNWRFGANYIRDYKEMIAIYAALPAAPRIYLCTPCPVYGAGNFDISPTVVKNEVAPAVRNLATELGLSLIDLNGRMTNSVWFPDTVHPNSKGMAAMTAVMFEGLSGGLPNEAPPELLMERTSATRIILKWPAKWGALVPEATTVIAAKNTPWSILEIAIPVGDGIMIRQTNNLSSTTQRYFQLGRP